MINTNVIEAARICGVKKLIAFLSTCVFPDDIEYPLTESKIHSGEPHSSNYPYAYAKRMVDIQIRAYREQYGLNYVSVIPTNVYGPNDNFNIDNGHVLPALIHKCYLAKNNNTDFSVWGSGKPLREFIYSEDASGDAKNAHDVADDGKVTAVSGAGGVVVDNGNSIPKGTIFDCWCVKMNATPSKIVN